MGYVGDGDRVFETYWTSRRGVQAMDHSYALMDLIVWGRQEPWEDSPTGWPPDCTNVRTDSGAPAWTPTADWTGRPICQWPRLDAGHDDDLGINDEGPAPNRSTATERHRRVVIGLTGRVQGNAVGFGNLLVRILLGVIAADERWHFGD